MNPLISLLMSPLISLLMNHANGDTIIALLAAQSAVGTYSLRHVSRGEPGSGSVAPTASRSPCEDQKAAAAEPM